MGLKPMEFSHCAFYREILCVEDLLAVVIFYVYYYLHTSPGYLLDRLRLLPRRHLLE